MNKRWSLRKADSQTGELSRLEPGDEVIYWWENGCLTTATPHPGLHVRLVWETQGQTGEKEEQAGEPRLPVFCLFSPTSPSEGEIADLIVYLASCMGLECEVEKDPDHKLTRFSFR